MSLSQLDVSAIKCRPGSGRSTADFREMADCSTHGPYLVRANTEGQILAYNPGGCPDCLRAARTKSLLAASNIPARFVTCDFDNYEADTPKQQRVLDACRAYAVEFDQHLAAGRGLIMLGNPGTGKNHLTTAICKAVQAQRRTMLRVKASEFLDAFWGKDFGERDNWIRELARVHLLVLDEVGRSSSTANAQNAFFRLIDARYEAVRPTMLLSNLDRQGVVEVLGDAAYDRLTEAGAQRLTFDWESRRAKTSRDVQA
jgi:DNA replication protein DnaC